MSCRNPYAELLAGAEGNAWAVLEMVRKGTRPLLPTSSDATIEVALCVIIKRCWAENASDRPLSFACISRAIDIVIACGLELPTADIGRVSTGMSRQTAKWLRQLVRRTCRVRADPSAIDGPLSPVANPVDLASVLRAVERLLGEEGDVGDVLLRGSDLVALGGGGSTK